LRRFRRKHCVNERASYARIATLVCRCRPFMLRVDAHKSRWLGTGGELEFGMRATMAHLVDKDFVQRANTVLLLGILWGALAACVIGALAYDVAYWLEGW
jgi:hypothetical protein